MKALRRPWYQNFAPPSSPIGLYVHLAGRAVDKIPAHVAPAPCEGHQPSEKARQPLVGAVAVADDDRAEESFAEQLVRRLGAAARIDMEADCVAADRGPQPGPARPFFPTKLLDAPTGLVGMAQRRLVPNGAEESTLVEIEVKAHKRVIRRPRWRRTCKCSSSPHGSVGAPGAAAVPQNALRDQLLGALFVRALCLLPPRAPRCRVVLQQGPDGLARDAGR